MSKALSELPKKPGNEIDREFDRHDEVAARPPEECPSAEVIDMAAKRQPANGWAIACLLLSVGSLLFWAFSGIPLPAIAGLAGLFGMFGLRAIQERQIGGKRLAWIGIFLSWIHLLAILFAFSYTSLALFMCGLVPVLAFWKPRDVGFGFLLLLTVLGLTIVGVAAPERRDSFRNVAFV